MTMTMVAQQHQLIDPRLVVPLCIRENILEGDYLLPPESPHALTKASLDTGVLASPTSIIEAIECLPHGGEGSQRIDKHGKENNKSRKKKNKKSKPKLFRPKKRGAKDEAEKAKQEVLRRAALRMKLIQEEEDADFAALRLEEEESPKLDMLVHYPLTLMEEVLSIPTPDSEETDEEEDGQENEEYEAPHPKSPEVATVLDLGKFETDVHSLRVSQMVLRRFVSHPSKFAELQKELREGRCITDETLRQKLHVFCQRDDVDTSYAGRDFFSEPSDRKRGWSTKLPMAYRRMQVFPATIDWRQFADADPHLSAALRMETPNDDNNIHATKKKKSDRKILKNVPSKSLKGKDSSHEEDQDDAAEDSLAEAYYNKEKLKGGVGLLSYCVRDVVPIVEDEDVFANLQHELKKIGAVTNEVLKQGLHFYVRDVRLQRERELAAANMQTSEEKGCSDVIGGPSMREENGDKRHKPLLQKLRFRSRRKV